MLLSTLADRLDATSRDALNARDEANAYGDTDHARSAAERARRTAGKAAALEAYITAFGDREATDVEIGE